MKYELIHADCRDVLANMADDSVDSIVTDPPYHLTSIVKRFATGTPAQHGTDGAYARASRGFMGQTWDGGDVAFDPALWAECLRVLKPGGYLLAFSGTRTYHRMACAIDDAGFEIRDMISWLYGSGFPKSHAVDKALQAIATTGSSSPTAQRKAAMGDAYEKSPLAGTPGYGTTGNFNNKDTGGGGLELTDPTAQQWAGWGTALKPACEPICMARKPLIGTVAANVLAHGTGGINIDGCRVATVERAAQRSDERSTVDGRGMSGGGTGSGTTHRCGRFPANVCHDGSDEVVAGFPAQAGAAAPVRGTEPSAAIAGVYNERERVPGAFHGDSGSAARFFYCAKASRADREDGNTHPTVKPEALMRWLCRMVTPPGGLVFDPFTGSGSTGKAAMLEGFRFLGAEMTAEYMPIARGRIAAALTRASN